MPNARQSRLAALLSGKMVNEGSGDGTGGVGTYSVTVSQGKVGTTESTRGKRGRGRYGKWINKLRKKATQTAISTGNYVKGRQAVATHSDQVSRA